MTEETYTEHWKSLNIAIARLDKEPAEAYQGFLCYSSLRGKQRNIERVGVLLGFDRLTVQFWSRTHHWPERVSAVDAQVWIKEQQEREQLTRADNEKFARENAALKEKTLRINRKMLDVAENLLESATVAGKLVETGHVTTADGREVPTHTEIHMKAKISDIPRMVDSAVKNSRLVNELPTDIVERKFPNGSELSKLSDEELERMREDNREVLVRSGVLQENGQIN